MMGKTQAFFSTLEVTNYTVNVALFVYSSVLM